VGFLVRRAPYLAISAPDTWGPAVSHHALTSEWTVERRDCARGCQGHRPESPGTCPHVSRDTPPTLRWTHTSADESASAIHFSILARPRPSGGTQGVTGGVKARCNRSDSADGGRHAAEVHRGAALVPRAWHSGHPFARFVRPLWPQETARLAWFRLQHLPPPEGVRPQHTARTRADSSQIGTKRPPRVSLDCRRLGGSGSVHTLPVTCSAAIQGTPLHFDTGDDADTCPPMATS